MTHYAEADALERAFWDAVGWCLQYRIKVYVPGGDWKSLGEMRDEIAAYRRAHPEPEDEPVMWARSRLFDDHVQAYCTNGHRMVLWGNCPMMARQGEQVRWWGSPFKCHCGAECFGGRR